MNFFLRCVISYDRVELQSEIGYIAQILDTLLVIRYRRKGNQALALTCSIKNLDLQWLANGGQTLDRSWRQSESKLLERGLAHRFTSTV